MTSIDVYQVQPLYLAALKSFLESQEYRFVDYSAVGHLPEGYVARSLLDYVLTSSRLLLIPSILLFHCLDALGIHVETVNLGGLCPALLRMKLYHAEAQEF